MKIYKLSDVAERGLLPYSVKTLRRMHEAGDIEFVDIRATGDRPVWGITDKTIEEHIQKVLKRNEDMGIQTK